MKVVKDNRELFSMEIETNFWRNNKTTIKRLLYEYRCTNEPIQVILEYRKLFEISVNLNYLLKSYLQSLILKPQ